MQTTKIVSPFSPFSPSQVCADGYVRLTFCEFLTRKFAYRRAWHDAELRNDLLCEGLPVDRAGYCEWLSEMAGARLSMGWAWFKSTPGRHIFLAPEGISTNLMLITPKRFDFGAEKTELLLWAWLANQAWKPKTISETFEEFEPS